MIRLLVCGGRKFSNRELLFQRLDDFLVSNEVEVVIEGEATGADRLGRVWGEFNGISVEPYPAQWGVYGRSAGPIRNQQMLDEGKPTHAFAFFDRPRSESRGTADMVRRLKKAGVPVEEIGP